MAVIEGVNVNKLTPTPWQGALRLHEQRRVLNDWLLVKAVSQKTPNPSNNQITPKPQPSEPILFPKLRIYFADFPYPHCSIGTRGWSPWRPDAVMSTTSSKNWWARKSYCFFAQEAQKSTLPRIFKGRPRRSWQTKKRSAFPSHTTVSPDNLIPRSLKETTNKKFVASKAC